MVDCPTPGPQAGRLFSYAVVASLFLTLSVACTPKTDFDRPVSSYTDDELLPSVRKFMAKANHKPVTEFSLTDDELLLRTYRRRIDRDMSYSTVESGFIHTMSTVGLAQEQMPHSGKNFRARENVKRPVVDISEQAQKNPHALKQEIDEDIVIIRKFAMVSRRVLRSDRLRRTRLRTMKSATKADRNDVYVRGKKNRNCIKYIQHVAQLRVKRYYRAIDRISISTPNDNLGPAKKSLYDLKHKVRRAKSLTSSRRVAKRKRSTPTSLGKTL